jgi:hypothetical protein
MSRRTSPVDVVIQFFETAPLEQAQVVLTIARGILARRTPKAKRPSGSAASHEAAKPEARPFPPNREVREGDLPATTRPR